MPTAAERVIQIIFRGEDEVSGVLKTIGGNIDGFAARAGRINDAVGDITAPFAALAGGVLKADAALGALAAGGLVLAVRESSRFNDAFAETTTLFEASPAAVEKFRADLLAYATDARVGIEDINAAVYDAISATGDYEGSLRLVAQAEKLAIGGKTDLASATGLVAAALNAYGLEADQAESVTDALFTAVRTGVTTVPELASSLSQVIGVAANAGISFDSLLAAVSTLTASGLPTSQAVTAIKAAISNVIKPTSEAQKVAAELGVEFNAAALESKGLAGFMGELGDKTGGNVETMGRLFGSVEGLNGALILTGQGAERFTDTLGAMENKAGATEAAYAKLADEFSRINQRFENGVKALLVGIGDRFKDAVIEVVDGGREIVNALEASVTGGAFDPLFSALESRLDELGRFLSAVAAALPEALESVDFSGLVRAFDDLGGEFRDLFGDIDLTTPEGLAAALQDVVDGVKLLINVTSGMVSGAAPFIDALEDIVRGLLGMDDATQKAAGEALGFGGALNKVSQLAGGFIDSIGGIGDGLKALAGASVFKTLLGPGGLPAIGPALTAVTSAGAPLLVWMGAFGTALAATGISVAKFVQEARSLEDANETARNAQERAARSAAELAGKYREISESTGVVIRNTEDFHRAIKAGEIVFDKTTKTWHSAADAAERVSMKTVKVAEDADQLTGVFKDLSDGTAELVLVSDRAAKSMDGNRESAIAARAAFFELQGNTPEMARRMAELEDPVARVSKVMEEAAEDTEAVRLKALQLASDERLKRMELSVDLRVAEIEADTQRIKAAFESIDNSIDSTGQTVSSLVGALADISSSDPNSIAKSNAIQRQLKEENRERREAFELQRKLTEAQIENIRIKNKKLRDGDSLIQIDTNGLEPALEMVIWNMLEKIQIRATEEAAEFLLGLEPPPPEPT